MRRVRAVAAIAALLALCAGPAWASAHSEPRPKPTGPVVHGRLYVQYAGRHAGHPYGGWYVAARLPHGGEIAVAIRSARGGPFEVQLAPGVYQMGGMHWVLGRGLDKRLCDARTITIREGVAPRFLTIRCKIG